MEEENELHKRIKKRGMIISRIPDFAKQAFIQRAKIEFEDDYGMCLAAMVKESNEYNMLKSMFFQNELNIQLSIGGNPGLPEPTDEEFIKTGSGKIIKKRRSS